MTDKKNIEDVTDSPEDWDDFWFNEDLGLSYSVDEETMRELMKLAIQLVTTSMTY